MNQIIKLDKLTEILFSKKRSNSFKKKSKYFKNENKLRPLKNIKINNLKLILLRKYENKFRLNDIDKKIIYNFIKNNYLDDDTRKLLILVITNTHINMSNNENYYSNLTQNYNNELINIKLLIKNDIKRTNNYNNFDDNIKDKMNNILFNFCKRNQIISYCQGMNFIIEYFLNNGFPEEECFWIIVHLFENCLPPKYYINMSPIIFFLNIINEYLKNELNTLYRHFKEKEINMELYLLECFILLFLNIKDLELKKIILYYVFLNGYSVLIKFSILIFKKYEKRFLKENTISSFKTVFLETLELIDVNFFKKNINNIYLNNFLLKRFTYYIEKKKKIKKKFTNCDNMDNSFCFNNLEVTDYFLFKKKNISKRVKSNFLFNKDFNNFKEDNLNNLNKEEQLIIRKKHNCSAEIHKNNINSFKRKIYYFNDSENNFKIKMGKMYNKVDKKFCEKRKINIKKRFSIS